MDKNFIGISCGSLEQSKVSTTGSWIAKSLAIGAGIALVTGGGFYMFFRVHQELDIQPSYGFKLGAIAFALSAIVAMIYFRNRSGAQ